MAAGTMRPTQPRLHECVRAFESQFEHVHRTLRRQGVPAADVDDLAQEVFIVMWRRWSEFDRTRALRPWLDGIAFNVVGSHLRRPRREIPLPDLEVMDPAPQGEDGLAAVRAKRVVLRSLERLPEMYRTVLVLRDVEGVPMRQIAAAQQVPLFTAYTRLRKARRDFAAAVKAEAFGPARRRGWFLVAAAGLALATSAATVGALSRWHPRAPRVAVSSRARVELGRGLRAYWRFDEAGGTTARDLSGQANDCVLYTPAVARAWRAGRLGAAVELRARDWLQCPQPAIVDGGASSLTVAAWALVRAIPAIGNRAVVTRELGTGANDHFFLGFINGSLIVNSETWNVDIRVPASADGRWHHLAFTVSADRATLYRDGRAVGTQRLGRVRHQPVETPIVIGGGSNQPGVVHELLDGAVDETVIYDRALGAAEIAALAAGAQPAVISAAARADPCGGKVIRPPTGPPNKCYDGARNLHSVAARPPEGRDPSPGQAGAPDR
jgi:RNA polymerase sigma factor (sigma-70 family)